MDRFKQIFRLLLITVFLGQFPLAAHAQLDTKITLNVKKVTVQEFFHEIEQQTTYHFSFRESEVSGKASVTLKVKEMALNKLLDFQLPKLGLSYTVVKDAIVVKPVKEKVQVEKSFDLIGRVVDEDDAPVIGAGVVVKGTANGAVTDLDGNFTIYVNQGDVLEITSLGYKTADVVVGRASKMDIVLENDVMMLNEAVAVGYGTTLRKNLTTSVAVVKAESVSKAAVSNMGQMLMGKAAGLRANISSTQPGGKVDISIRGGGTPIYIVDGIMMPSGSLEVGSGSIEVPNSINRDGLAGLNPGDIESIEVLKDASAAIYGINAANGVILITTKKGHETTPRVTWESSYSFVRNYKYLEPLDSREYMNFSNIFSKEDYLLNHEMVPYGPNEYDGKWTPVYYPDQINNAKTTNWLDYILRPGHINNHSISVTGGSKNVSYYLAGNFYEQKGTVINSGMKRYTFRSNVSVQMFPFLKLNSVVNINSNSYTNSNADGGGAGGVGKDALQTALMFPPDFPVYDSEGKYVRFRSAANPAEMDQYKDNTNSNGWYVNFSADLKLYKDILKLRGVYGYNHETSRRSLFIPTTLMWYEVAGVSRGHLGEITRSDRTIEGMLTYSQNIKDIVNIDAVLGIGFYNDGGFSHETDYKNANDNIGPDNIAAAKGPFVPVSGKWENRKRSQFARVAIDVLDRYVISGSIRRDGTDKFFPGKKYSWFPSGSVAWKISNEKFMKKASWVDLLKLRASYGVTGRDNLGASMYGIYRVAPTYVKFDNNSVTYIPYLKSGSDYPDVSWEKTIMKNIGLDFHFFKDRLWGSMDVFRNDVTDLLGYAPGEPLSMVGTRPVNYGHYFRAGWDLALNSENFVAKGDGFGWKTTLTLTQFNAKWVERTQNYDYQEYQIRKNEPMNALYYYHVTGIINKDRSNMPESQKSLGEMSQLPGYPIVEDKNSDGVIDLKDIYMENTLPKISIGFGNTFTYKNFDLDIFLYGQFGSTRYNYAMEWAGANGFANRPAKNQNQFTYLVWNSQNNDKGTLSGIAIAKGEALPGNCGWDLGRQKADFVRVRNITFGYNLQGRLLGKVVSKRVDNIRFYIDFQNPFTITAFSGVDPEIYIGNWSSPAGYPMTRSYSLGVKFNFK